MEFSFANRRNCMLTNTCNATFSFSTVAQSVIDKLFDDAAVAGGDEVEKVGYVVGFGGAGDGGDGFADGGQGVGGVEFAGVEEAVGVAELLDLGGGEAAALQAYFVDAVGVVVALDGGEGVGEDVEGGHGASADVGVLAYAAELGDGREGSDAGGVL